MQSKPQYSKRSMSQSPALADLGRSTKASSKAANRKQAAIFFNVFQSRHGIADDEHLYL